MKIWPSMRSFSAAISSLLGLAIILSAMNIISLKSIVKQVPFRAESEIKAQIMHIAGKIDETSGVVWLKMKHILFLKGKKLNRPEPIFTNTAGEEIFGIMEKKMHTTKEAIQKVIPDNMRNGKRWH
jgi:hypothetical protein